MLGEVSVLIQETVLAQHPQRAELLDNIHQTPENLWVAATRAATDADGALTVDAGDVRVLEICRHFRLVVYTTLRSLTLLGLPPNSNQLLYQFLETVAATSANLTSLELTGVVCGMYLVPIARMRSLVRLTMDLRSLEGPQLDVGVIAPPALTALVLQRSISPATQRDFAASLAAATSVRDLELTDSCVCSVATVHYALASAISALTQLTRLNLRASGLRGEMAGDVVVAAGSLRRLRALDLSDNDLSDCDETDIYTIRKMSAIEDLRIARAHAVRADVALVVYHLCREDKLRVLDAGDAGDAGDAAEEADRSLVLAAQAGGLCDLTLHGQLVTADDLDELAQHCTVLTALDLRSCELARAARDRVARALSAMSCLRALAIPTAASARPEWRWAMATFPCFTELQIDLTRPWTPPVTAPCVDRLGAFSGLASPRIARSIAAMTSLTRLDLAVSCGEVAGGGTTDLRPIAALTGLAILRAAALPNTSAAALLPTRMPSLRALQLDQVRPVAPAGHPLVWPRVTRLVWRHCDARAEDDVRAMARACSAVKSAAIYMCDSDALIGAMGTHVTALEASTAGVEAHISRFTRLRNLCIYSEASVNVCAQISSLTGLTSLTIDVVAERECAAAFCGVLRSCCSLQVLQIGAKGAWREHVLPAFEALAAVTGLRRLSWNGVGCLGEDEMRALGAALVRPTRSIADVDVRGWDIDADGLRVFAACLAEGGVVLGRLALSRGL